MGTTAAFFCSVPEPIMAWRMSFCVVYHVWVTEIAIHRIEGPNSHTLLFSLTSFVAITSSCTGSPISAAMTPAVTWPAAPVGIAKLMRGREAGEGAVSCQAGSVLVSWRWQ